MPEDPARRAHAVNSGWALLRTANCQAFQCEAPSPPLSATCSVAALQKAEEEKLGSARPVEYATTFACMQNAKRPSRKITRAEAFRVACRRKRPQPAKRMQATLTWKSKGRMIILSYNVKHSYPDIQLPPHRFLLPLYRSRG